MNRLPTVGLTLLAISFLVSPLAAQRQCDYRREILDAVELAPDGRMAVRAGAGTLRITGRPGLSRLSVTGTACASDASRLQGMTIITRTTGEEASLETVIPESREFFGMSEYAYIDLILEVPEGAMLDVTDGSGSAEIAGVRGGLIVDDGSGDLRLENIGGGLRVDDGSGSLTIRDVDGDVRIVDGSGSIVVANVRGSVFVDDDGSGPMDIRDVTNSVVVREDGSGSIRVERAGELIVDRDGGGGIRYTEIAGTVRIPRDRR